MSELDLASVRALDVDGMLDDILNQPHQLRPLSAIREENPA